MSRFLVLLGALAALTLHSGCQLHDGCTPLASRCDGNVAELCDPDGDWFVVADCDAVDPRRPVPWTCVAPSAMAERDAGLATATCVPVEPLPVVDVAR